MSKSTLDAAEAARITLVETEDMSRAIRRLGPATDLLERAAASFAQGLVVGRPPDGHDLLTRFEPDARLRARAIDELRLHMSRERQRLVDVK